MVNFFFPMWSFPSHQIHHTFLNQNLKSVMVDLMLNLSCNYADKVEQVESHKLVFEIELTHISEDKVFNIKTTL